MYVRTYVARTYVSMCVCVFQRSSLAEKKKRFGLGVYGGGHMTKKT